MSFDPDMDSSFNSKQDDSGCYATFFLHPIIDGFKSKEAGREIYTEVPYILILVKGQNKTEVRRKATDEDKRRFPREWGAFQDGKINPITGTPLESLNLAAGIIQELKHLNIRTVEDVAEISDLTIQKIGIGGVEMRNQAKAFLSKNSVKVLTHANGRSASATNSRAKSHDRKQSRTNQARSPAKGKSCHY